MKAIYQPEAARMTATEAPSPHAGEGLAAVHGSASPCQCKECAEYRRYLAWKKKLAANDAARITDPDYNDLWNAYVAGARSGQKHPNADDYWLNRAADGYCKLVHATKDPEHFAAMGNQNTPTEA
jgi:hypothetical protein